MTLLKNGFVIFVLFIVGCSSGSDEDKAGLDISKADLSGTWKLSTIEEIYHSESREYLYSEFSTKTLIITDSSSKFTYSDCIDYDRKPEQIGIKTDKNIYLDQGETRFTTVSNQRLITQKEVGIEYSWLPNRYVDKHYELEKISEEILLDKGMLSLNGPVSVTEYSQVCLTHFYSNLFDDSSYGFGIPYQDGEIYFSMRLTAQPKEQTYNFTRYEEGADILLFDIQSNTKSFEEITGTDYIFVESAKITITESLDNILSGVYEFIGPNDEIYDGEFQLELSN